MNTVLFRHSQSCHRLLSALALVTGLSLAVGCGGDADSETGQLPSSGGSSTDAGDGDGDGDGDTSFPASYRFDCIDIQGLGDADGTNIQAGLLEQAWSSDINNHKLNILANVTELDEAAGTGTMVISSGVGTSDSDLCAQQDTIAMEVPVAFDDSLTKWVESSDAGTCSGMGTTPGFGTFNFGSDPSQIFYIYAEDDDGTPFSCTVDERPDAVPLRGVVAEFSLAADGQLASGTLTGCLSEADADSLCSCIGACDPSLPVPASCEGCMPGGLPLGSLLSGINTSENCTTLLGEPAFDMVVGFTATRIPSIPETCM